MTDNIQESGKNESTQQDTPGGLKQEKPSHMNQGNQTFRPNKERNRSEKPNERTEREKPSNDLPKAS